MRAPSHFIFAMRIFGHLQHALDNTYRLVRELGRWGNVARFPRRRSCAEPPSGAEVLSRERAAVVSVERFSRETLPLAWRQHPHFVPVRNVGSLHGLPWVSLPHIEGEKLRALIGCANCRLLTW